MLKATYSPPARANPLGAAQIIGLIKSRMSGITLSRHAYADVLRTIFPSLRDTTTAEARQAPCRINVWAARPMSRVVFDDIGQRLPGVTIWCLVLESTNLPDGSLDACANADQVWVPTHFVRRVCISGGMPPEKVRVVPYYIPPPDELPAPPAEDSPFTVLVSWDGRSSMNRKNVVNSVGAFKQAFATLPDVRLRLKTRDLPADRLTELRREVGDDARIEITDASVDAVNDVFAGVHCLLHITRAEGYGRHVIEAMQRRVPTIVTDYSGPCDWVTADNALLVPHTLVETRQAEFQYPQGGCWAAPDIAAAAEHLRRVRSIRASAAMRCMLDAAQRDSIAHTSLERSRRAMMDCLSPYL
jgi:glycosyltransferase involved in cell wall biosynthesis